MPFDASTLTPFVLGWPELLGPLARVDPVPELTVLDATHADQVLFARLLNAANALAFDSLGMPLWVQLDCATLPSGFHGFAVPRASLPAATWQALCGVYARLLPDGSAAALETYTGLVPVSGFCAVRTPEPGTIVAFSLWSILRGHGLGVRTKALGLLAHRAARQVGITQYANAAVRVHTAFGPLQVVAPRAHGHTHPEASFLYALDVPSRDVLLARYADGRLPRVAPPEDARLVEIDQMTATRLSREPAGSLTILPPGISQRGERAFLVLQGAAGQGR